MVLARLIAAMLITLLPLVALATPGRGDDPRWNHATYNPYQLAANGKRWEDMSPREQEEIRRRKAQYDSLPATEKRKLRNAREHFEKMPPERRREMRERWEKMPAEEKRRYKLEKKERKQRD